MKTKILFVVFLLSLSAALMAQSVEKGPKREFRGKENGMRMQHKQGNNPAQSLNLTDVQKEAFKKGMMATHKQIQPLQNELGEALAHQKTLTTAEKPDWTAIERNIEKIGDIRVKMAKVKARQHLDMRAQLNDEQRMKFDRFASAMTEEKGPKGLKHKMAADRERQHMGPLPE